jgi:hypothetical protein
MLNTIKVWATNLANSFSKPQTYSSGLEYYIVKNNPQNAGDIDRLTREYHHKQHDGVIWARGF